MTCVIVELPIRKPGGQLQSWDEPKALNDARDARRRTGAPRLFGGVRGTEVPGWSLVDLNIGDRLLQADNARASCRSSRNSQTQRTQASKPVRGYFGTASRMRAASAS